MTDIKKTEPMELQGGEHHELLKEGEHLLELTAGVPSHNEDISIPDDTTPTTQEIETLPPGEPHTGTISADVGSVPSPIESQQGDTGTHEISPQRDDIAPIPHTPDQPLYAVEHATEHPHKSHGWMILLIVLFFIILGGGAWWFYSSLEQRGGDVSYTISAEAPKTYEESIAQKIQENEKNVELMNRAMQEQNASLCDAILAPDQKNICHESVQSMLYVLSGSITDCEKLTSSDIRGRCESALAQKSAIASMDKSLCVRIQDIEQSQYCREEIDAKVLTSLIETKTATETSCNLLEEKNKAACLASIVRIDDSTILQKALQSDDIDACRTLSTTELQHSCSDTISMRRAVSTGSATDCEPIFDGDKKSACLQNISSHSDTSVFQNAIIEKNISACESIKNSVLQNRCRDAVTLLLVRDSGNADMCDSLSNTGMIESCRTSVTNR